MMDIEYDRFMTKEQLEKIKELPDHLIIHYNAFNGGAWYKFYYAKKIC